MSGLRECGHDVDPILAAIGIDDAMLEDPDSRVPTSVAMALMARSVEQTGDSKANRTFSTEDGSPSTRRATPAASRSRPLDSRHRFVTPIRPSGRWT